MSTLHKNMPPITLLGNFSYYSEAPLAAFICLLAAGGLGTAIQFACEMEFSFSDTSNEGTLKHAAFGNSLAIQILALANAFYCTYRTYQAEKAQAQLAGTGLLDTSEDEEEGKTKEDTDGQAADTTSYFSPEIKAAAFVLFNKLSAFYGSWVYLDGAFENAALVWPLNYAANSGIVYSIALMMFSAYTSIYINAVLNDYTNETSLDAEQFQKDWQKSKAHTVARLLVTLSALAPFWVLAGRQKGSDVLKAFVFLFATFTFGGQNYMGSDSFIDAVKNTGIAVVNSGVFVFYKLFGSMCSATRATARNQAWNALISGISLFFENKLKVLLAKKAIIQGDKNNAPENLSRCPEVAGCNKALYALGFVLTHLISQMANFVAMSGYSYATASDSLGLVYKGEQQAWQLILSGIITFAPFLFLSMKFTYSVFDGLYNIAITGIPNHYKQEKTINLGCTKFTVQEYKLRLLEYGVIAAGSTAVTLNLNEELFMFLNMPHLADASSGWGATLILAATITTITFNAFGKLEQLQDRKKEESKQDATFLALQNCDQLLKPATGG